MAVPRKIIYFWTLELCLVTSKLPKALTKIPKLPTIYDPTFIHEVVESHNELRGKVNPPAADMNFMDWDTQLAKLAKSWTRQCKYSYNPCIKKRYGCIENYDFLGENIYLGKLESTPKEVISHWYNQSKHYNFETMTCSKTCGHYTQVVWANSLKVGCAVSNCPNLLGKTAGLFVCDYLPAGNDKNTSPYIKGEPCSMCEASICDKNLCYPVTERATQQRAGRLLMLGFILHKLL